MNVDTMEYVLEHNQAKCKRIAELESELAATQRKLADAQVYHESAHNIIANLLLTNASECEEGDISRSDAFSFINQGSEPTELQAAIDKAVADETEACLSLCFTRNPFSKDHANGMQHVADLIRERKK